MISGKTMSFYKPLEMKMPTVFREGSWARSVNIFHGVEALLSNAEVVERSGCRDSNQVDGKAEQDHQSTKKERHRFGIASL